SDDGDGDYKTFTTQRPEFADDGLWAELERHEATRPPGWPKPALRAATPPSPAPGGALQVLSSAYGATAETRV
ncbi:hypothetical protein ABTZ92_30505, partial [Streptomyces albidoflavus]|uniref:hypothetical protein n=1 Tax=Streptomyces albidoflavus TaxID=1886 RepID=UPI00332E9F63